jgi:acetyl esterase/lipase
MQNIHPAGLMIGMFLFVVGVAVAGEPLVVNLWPGETPGDTGIEGEEKARVFESPIVGPTKLVTNVSKPTLTVYLPPKKTNTGTAMVICPGGGYWELFWELEGVEVAAWLNSIGITGIILKYRVPRRVGEPRGEPPPGPLLDAQRAVSLVRSRASEWGVDPARIGIVGFSAGGHLALATATTFEHRQYGRIDGADDVSCRPDFVVLCYSGFLKATDKDELWPGLHIPSTTPPVLLTHTSDDTISSSENSAIMYLALKRANIPAELHIYASGDHDFGVRQNGRLPASWTKLCVNWLRSLGLLKTLE